MPAEAPAAHSHRIDSRLAPGLCGTRPPRPQTGQSRAGSRPATIRIQRTHALSPPAPRQRRGHRRRLLPHARSQSQERNHLEQDLINLRGGDFYLATSGDKNLAVDITAGTRADCTAARSRIVICFRHDARRGEPLAMLCPTGVEAGKDRPPHPVRPWRWRMLAGALCPCLVPALTCVAGSCQAGCEAQGRSPRVPMSLDTTHRRSVT